MWRKLALEPVVLRNVGFSLIETESLGAIAGPARIPALYVVIV